MAKNKNKQPPSREFSDRGKYNKTGFWGMMRDVLVASIYKGQLPLACGFFIILIFILKLGSDNLFELAKSIILDLKSGYMIGYFFCFIAIMRWIIHSTWQRKNLNQRWNV